jgi:2-polyprenyl-6-methoxyphenol hydroxylase-like FAD-dependent oxidoreductase
LNTSERPRVDVPVLIIGGGPVGLALAGELGWRGINCILVEKGDGIVLTPKMNEVNTRSMEFCRRWGIDKYVTDCPFPENFPMDVVITTTLVDEELGRIKRPARKNQRPGEHSPSTLQVCSQTWFDPILKKFANSFDTVSMMYHHRLETFDDDGTVVKAMVRDIKTDQLKMISANYLAGCDGGSSLVRNSLGVELLGTNLIDCSLNIFFKSAELVHFNKNLPATFYFLLGENGVWANLRVIDPDAGLWRLLVRNVNEELDITEAYQQNAIYQAVGTSFDIELVDHNLWKRRAVVAERYSKGNVFLVGDAAHQLSPSGALGMNTGIGDAVDLAWKLAAKHRGWGGDNLLESYHFERQHVGFRNVTQAAEYNQDHENASVQQENRTAANERLVKKLGQTFQTEGMQIGYRYSESPICVQDGSVEPPDHPDHYHPSSFPGMRAPHAWIEKDQSTLDLFGREFVLLNFDSSETNLSPIERAAEKLQLPLKIEIIQNEDISILYQKKLVLVRPDGHVAWRGNSLPNNCTELLDIARGA